MDTVDFVGAFFQQQSALFQLQQAFVQSQQAFVQSQQAFVKSQEKLDDVRRENVELSVQNVQQHSQLVAYNLELLNAQDALSARGSMELLEKNYTRFPANCNGRQKKYAWLFNQDANFRRHVHSFFDQRVCGDKIGKLAEDLYNATSADIHNSIRYGSVVKARRLNYQPEQLRLLQAVCATLPIPIEII